MFLCPSRANHWVVIRLLSPQAEEAAAGSTLWLGDQSERRPAHPGVRQRIPEDPNRPGVGSRAHSGANPTVSKEGSPCEMPAPFQRHVKWKIPQRRAR